jgi:hypothetical protein
MSLINCVTGKVKYWGPSYRFADLPGMFDYFRFAREPARTEPLIEARHTESSPTICGP